MEVTTSVEALRRQRAALGGSATTRATTRVNAICAVAHMAFMAEQLSVGGARRSGDGGSAFTAPVTESCVGRNRPPAVGILWALHRWQTALAATGRGGAARLRAARGRWRWPRRWSCSPLRGLQTQVDRPGDSGSSASAPGGRRCASHDESRMAGHAQAPGWSIGRMFPAWQRGHWRNERPVSAS